MKSRALIAFAGAACLSLFAAAADNPSDAFKTRIKPGMYSYEMTMDMGAMPGMPPGMAKQNHTFQHCVTPEEISRGEIGKGGRGMPENCEMKNFTSGGNMMDYTLACKPSTTGTGPHGGMQSHNHMTFDNSGYVMDMDMQGGGGPSGQPMHMKQHVVAKFLGDCPAR